MDVSIIRIVAAALAAVVLGTIIYRRKSKSLSN
jgi:hypothetical protein